MSFLFGSTQAPPPPPPPPPNAPAMASPSISQQGAAERQSLAGAAGAGFSGTDVTGGKSAAPTNTTAPKALLGGSGT